jgi:hypothetical protein
LNRQFVQAAVLGTGRHPNTSLAAVFVIVNTMVVPAVAMIIRVVMSSTVATIVGVDHASASPWGSDM